MKSRETFQQKFSLRYKTDDGGFMYVSRVDNFTHTFHFGETPHLFATEKTAEKYKRIINSQTANDRHPEGLNVEVCKYEMKTNPGSSTVIITAGAGDVPEEMKEVARKLQDSINGFTLPKT